MKPLTFHTACAKAVFLFAERSGDPAIVGPNRSVLVYTRLAASRATSSDGQR
jgi:hypothetical protein